MYACNQSRQTLTTIIQINGKRILASTGSSFPLSSSSSSSSSPSSLLPPVASSDRPSRAFSIGRRSHTQQCPPQLQLQLYDFNSSTHHDRYQRQKQHHDQRRRIGIRSMATTTFPESSEPGDDITEADDDLDEDFDFTEGFAAEKPAVVVAPSPLSTKQNQLPFDGLSETTPAAETFPPVSTSDSAVLHELRTKDEIDEWFEHYLTARNGINALSWIHRIDAALKSPKKNRKVGPPLTIMERIQRFSNQSSISRQSKQDVLHFLAPHHSNTTTHAIDNIEDHDTDSISDYKPKKNKYVKYVPSLMEVRDLSVQNSLIFSRVSARKVKKELKRQKNKLEKKQILQQTGDTDDADSAPIPAASIINGSDWRQEWARTVHSQKTPEQLELEAREMAEFMATKLPKEQLQHFVAKLEYFSYQFKNSSTRRVKSLIFPLLRQTTGHAHRIAKELADFFYLNVPIIDPKDEQEEGHVYESSAFNVALADPKIVECELEWQEKKEQFISSFMSVQRALMDDERRRGNQDELDEEDLKQMREEESLLQTMAEVSDKKEDDEGTKSKSKSNRREHMNCEVLQFDPLWDPATATQSPNILTQWNFPDTCQADRLAFVDNLPIDMVESALLDAFSRCGKIEALKIFNQRPDLDPGRLPVHNRKIVKKPSTYSGHWKRPRTPLYAMIQFKDEEGCRTATQDQLRIFGMVYDKHLMRSYPSRGLTKLFIEDIPSNEYAQIETWVNDILGPELSISMTPAQAKIGRRVVMTNCTINFPSVEVAYWAYARLHQRVESEYSGPGEVDYETHLAPSVNWFRNPKDAKLYWTRQLNY